MTPTEAVVRRAFAHADHLGYDREELIRYLAERPELYPDEYDRGYADGYHEGMNDA